MNGAWLARIDRDPRLAIFWKLLGLAGAAHVIQVMAQHQARVGSFLEYATRWQQVVPMGFGATPDWLAVALQLALLAVSLMLVVTRRPTRVAIVLAVVATLGAFVQPVTISNHYVVLLLVVLSMPVVLVLARPGAGAAPERVTACARLASDGYARVLRHICVITYLFAGFHKLNTGWFDLEGNAATRLAAGKLVPMLEPLGLAVPWFLNLLLVPVLVFPVAAELAIPLMLLSRRLRALGALVGIGLHLPMFAREVLDYPSLILAFYVLFFPEEDVRRFSAQLRERTIGKLALTALGAAAVILVWLVILPATPARLTDPTWYLEVVFGSALITFWAYVGVTLLWELVRARWGAQAHAAGGVTHP